MQCGITNRVYLPRVRGNITGILTVKAEIILWRKEGRTLYPLTMLAEISYFTRCSCHHRQFPAWVNSTLLCVCGVCMLLGQTTCWDSSQIAKGSRGSPTSFGFRVARKGTRLLLSISDTRKGGCGSMDTLAQAQLQPTMPWHSTSSVCII